MDALCKCVHVKVESKDAPPADRSSPPLSRPALQWSAMPVIFTPLDPASATGEPDREPLGAGEQVFEPEVAAQSEPSRRRLVVALATTTILAAVGSLALFPGALRKVSARGVREDYERVGELPRFVEQPLLSSAGHVKLSVESLGFQSNGTFIVGHFVKVDNPVGRVSLATPPGGCGTLQPTTKTARDHVPQCRLAMNAGFFDPESRACVGNLVANGKVLQSVPLAQSNVNFGIRHEKVAVGYFTQEEVAGFDELVSGLTWLVRDGKNNVREGWREANTSVQTAADQSLRRRTGRSAVGVDAKGSLLLLQVDGKSTDGKWHDGFSMSEVADLLVERGAVQAINLDGGGSSEMAMDGQLINYPSSQGSPSGELASERKVSSVLCVHDPQPDASSAMQF